jgi:hypothetical protein
VTTGGARANAAAGALTLSRSSAPGTRSSPGRPRGPVRLSPGRSLGRIASPQRRSDVITRENSRMQTLTGFRSDGRPVPADRAVLPESRRTRQSASWRRPRGEGRAGHGRVSCCHRWRWQQETSCRPVRARRRGRLAGCCQAPFLPAVRVTAALPFPARTRMRLACASSALGTRISRTPSWAEASILSG